MRRTIKTIIKEILRRDGKIDNFYCIENKITTRLAAVINLIREEDGWELEGGYIDGTKNWQYRLVDGPKRRLLRVEQVIKDGVCMARPIYGI